MGIKKILNEVKLKIHVKQLDKVTFLGFVSGVMAASSGRNPMTPEMHGVKTEKKMPIWDRLVKAKLLTKKDLGNDVSEFYLTKLGARYANTLIDDGELYNPNKIRFKA